MNIFNFFIQLFISLWIEVIGREEEHIVGVGKIRSIILGLNDGLIYTFTLLVGVATATLGIIGSNIIVTLTSMAAMGFK